MRIRGIIIGLIVAATCVGAAAVPPSPYAGQQRRAIKSLSAEQIAGYLAGEGLGYAKAGELNHYPGPRHVLAMADRLQLTPDQRARTRAIYARMHARAVALGEEIVAKERHLDALFASGTIDEATLKTLTAEIAQAEGRLRDVHLSAHLAERRVLSAEQVARYDRLRGYGSAMPAGTHHVHHMAM
jgi:Spy/CpxP family protein refolding chaperone